MILMQINIYIFILDWYVILYDARKVKGKMAFFGQCRVGREIG